MVEGDLASRLTRLAGRAVRLSSSSDEEAGALGGGSGGPAAPGAAAQALRQLLEHAAGDLSHLQRDLQMGGWLSRPGRPSSGGGGGEAAQPRQAALEQAAAAPRAAHGAAVSERSSSSHLGSGQGAEQWAQGSGELSTPPPANGGCAGSSDAMEALELGGLEEELHRQALAEAQRQQAREARERELQQMQLACAQQHLAACRIARGWRGYTSSPARSRRAAAATRIQSAWRGLVGRRAAALQRQRQALLVRLHAAIDSGERAGVQEAVERLGQLGFGADARQLLSSFEHDAAAAAVQLRAAASGGSAAEYQQALAQASKYGHLQAAAAEATAVFSGRVQEAEAALWAAAQARPAGEFRAAAAQAASLGVDPGVQRQAEAALLARNQQAAGELQAAVGASPFDPGAVQAACQRAEALGLHAEVVRAQRALDLRRRQAAQLLPALAERGSAEEIERAVSDARQLGLGPAAEAATTRLAQRRGQAERQLQALVDHGSLPEFEAAAGLAAALGVEPSQLEGCREHFAQRKAAAEACLAADAERGCVAAFRCSRAAALQLGLEQSALAAEQLLQLRRQAAAGELAAAARAVCALAAHVQQCCAGRGGDCPAAGAVSRGSAAAVLEGHLGLVRQLCEALGATAAERQGLQGAAALPAPARPQPQRTAASSAAVGSDSGCTGEGLQQLVERLCRRAPSALHQHAVGQDGGSGSGSSISTAASGSSTGSGNGTSSSGSGSGTSGSSSMRDALARFASAAAEAGQLELGQALGAALSAVLAQHEALLARCQEAPIPLCAPPSAAGPQHQQQQEQQQQVQALTDPILRQLQQQLPLGGQGAACWAAERTRSQEALLAGFRAWRAQQLFVLGPAGLAAIKCACQVQAGGADVAGGPEGAAAAAAAVPASASAGIGSGNRAGSRQWAAEGGEVSLDVSKQGLRSLELLAGSTSLRSLNLGTNHLTSLEGISALVHLRELVVPDNQLSSLSGVQGLTELTRLVVDDNPVTDACALSGLTSLRSLSLRGTMVPSVACLQRCQALTSLTLAGCPLGPNLAAALPPLPRLLSLDASACRLAALGPLPATCPLLRTLIASSNSLRALPGDLHLPFLTELWLNECGMAGVECWPWLPALRGLHLQGNALVCLPPMLGFPSLERLDLSFNALAHPTTSVGSLAPLARLQTLQLSDNPVAGSPGYAAAVAEALPWLVELDLEPLSEEERARRLLAARRRGRLLPAPGGGRGVAAGPVGAAGWLSEQQPEQQQEELEWGVAGLLWALRDAPGAAAALQQQPALRALATGAAAGGEAPSPLGCSCAALATLTALPSPPTPAAPPAAAAAVVRPADGSALALALQRQYSLLLAANPTSLEMRSLLVVSSGHFRAMLAALTRCAIVIQARWRGFAARRLRRRLAAATAARRRAGAVTAIQSVWRGWAARRRHAHVAERLAAWRDEWRRRQAALELHRRHRAATRLQAAWRGHRVRLLLRRARAAAQQRRRGTTSSSQETELLSTHSSLASLLGSWGEGSESPERLSPGLGAGLELGVEDSLLASLTGYEQQAGPSAAQGVQAAAGRGSLAAVPTVLAAQPVLFTAGLAPGLGTAMRRPGSGGGCRLPPLSPSSSASLVAAPDSSQWEASAGREACRLPPLRTASPPTQLACGESQRTLALAGAASSSEAPQDEGAGDWAFKDAATAAAFLHLRKKQAQQARKREVREQMKHPETRLQLFKQTNHIPAQHHHPAATAPGSRAQSGQSSISGNGSAARRPERSQRGGSTSRLPASGGSSPGSSLQHSGLGSPQPSSLAVTTNTTAGKGTGQGQGGPGRDGSAQPRRPVLLQRLFPFEF